MKNMHQLIERIIDKLAQQQHSISFAESCTGGRLAMALTSVSGASAVFNGSVVSYSNELKEQWLGVEASTLQNYGAVSKECVEQMLQGIIRMTHAHYAIAVSGIAGPTGGTKEKPVGTVYIGIRTPHSQEVLCCHFKGNREAIQSQSTNFALKKLAEVLQI